jgi:hypothetical protein
MTKDRRIEAEAQCKAALHALFKATMHPLMTGWLPVKEVES